jgi:hypothetical protein
MCEKEDNCSVLLRVVVQSPSSVALLLGEINPMSLFCFYLLASIHMSNGWGAQIHDDLN